MTRPLKGALADGCKVMSTHMCDIVIDGLPSMLTGHIISNLSTALLFGIGVLTEAGCKVNFDQHTCKIGYNSKVISTGMKDPSTDLWPLPLGTPSMTSQHVTNVLPLAAPVITNAHADSAVQIAFFTHTVRNKANSIHFSHQSLCSPQILTLLKAI
jgi:hypothetical protein